MGQSIVRQLAFLPPPSSYGPDLPNAWFNKKNGSRVPGLFIPAPDSVHDPFTLLFTHGNAEDMGMSVDWANLVSVRLGLNVLIYDYTGYGQNAGEPSESNCVEDVILAYRYLTVERNIPSKRVVLMGRSLGSGPTVYLAHYLSTADHHELNTERGDFGGVIIQSGIASCVRVVSNALAYVPFTDMFCNSSKMSKIIAPCFIMHGQKDDVVPFEHGQYLFSKLRKEAQWKFLPLPEANHNDIDILYEDLVYEQMQDFLAFLASRNK